MAGAGQLVQHPLGQVEVLGKGAGQVLVQGPAVGRRHAGHVVEGLGPALDLEAVHPRLADQVQEGGGAQVVGVQDVAAALPLPDLEQLAGAGLLAEVVFPAAGLGALAPVGVPAGQVVGQQAPARHAHAHGPVDKGLQLQLGRGLVPDHGDVGQAQLPGQHHPLGPHLPAGGGGGVARDAGLGGHMHVHIGGPGLAGVQHPQVGHDEGVHPGGGRLPDGVGHPGSLLVGGQGVQGQVDLAAPGVGVDHPLGQLFGGEVGGRGPHPKLGQGAVDGVRPVADGVAQPFQVPGGGQQFRYLKHGVPLFGLAGHSPALTARAVRTLAWCSARVWA